MVEKRSWIRDLLKWDRRSEDLERELDAMVEDTSDVEEDVFGLGVSLDELRAAVCDHKKDMRKLKAVKRNHLEKYKKYLDEIKQQREERGFADTDLKVEAQDHLDAYEDLDEEFDSVGQQFQVLKKVKRKYERYLRRRRRHERRGFSVHDVDMTGLSNRVEELSEEEQMEEQAAEELDRELGMLGASAEPDLEDVNKKIDEIEKERSKADDDWLDKRLDSQESERAEEESSVDELLRE